MSLESMVCKDSLEQGASATVRLVDNSATGQAIAVKLVKFGDGDVYLREVGMLVDLGHLCVLNIVGYSLPMRRAPTKIGTEYAANGWLRTAPKFLEDTGVVIIVCGIVLGMRFIHSRAAVHRDLKPVNILIDARGFAKLGDLDSGRFLDASRLRRPGVGTHCYMARDMYEDVDYMASIDVFALALILYDLLVGELIFRESSGRLSS